jgi:RNase adaptor protein for sRNA GlmZ degradation
LPRYGAGGKTYLTIAIGGTGGNRFVVVAERMIARSRDAGWQAELAHREFRAGADGAPLVAGPCNAAKC